MRRGWRCAKTRRCDLLGSVAVLAQASPRVKGDFRGLLNPQFSTTSVEVSTSKVVGPLLHSDRIEVQIGDIPVPPFVEDTVEAVHSLPQECLQQRTVDQEQIVAEDTTLNIANKEIPQERLPERIEEQIVGILVSPTVEEIVESVQIIQERLQQSIEEQIVDDRGGRARCCGAHNCCHRCEYLDGEHGILTSLAFD